jgi:large subunit ribosomal protein L21
VVDPVVDPSIETLLPLLRSQPPFYIRTHIHEKPYLVTEGDTVRLPFLMHGVNPGETLRLNRASILGSRDYTLKAGDPNKELGEKQKWLDERLFVCRATVMGVESEPLRIKEKTKRRQRHVRKIKSKHRYTVLRISEVTVNDANALKEAIPVVEGNTEVPSAAI